MQKNNDTLTKYGSSFQSKVISALLSDEGFFNNVRDITQVSYFDSTASQWIVDEILQYGQVYNKPPTLDVFKSQLIKEGDDVLKKTVVDQLRNAHTLIGSNDLKYVKDEFKTFCINQRLKSAILESVDLLQNGNYDQIKSLVDSAMKDVDSTDLGHDYFTDFDDRGKDLVRGTVSTPWDVINDLMDGGLGPGELAVVVAPSGVGKTWILTCLGAIAVKLGLNVVHYSFELSEHYVGARYDTVFTQIPSAELKNRRDEVKSKIKNLTGNLTIKYYPPKTATVNTLQTHIQKLIALGKKPDLIVVDYADLLAAKSNFKIESTYSEQGGVYIDLRGMGGELQIPIWTASQTNRCLSLNTEVDTTDGKIKIGKIKEGDEILTHDGYKKVTHVFPVEKQPVYRIKTKSGKIIECSARHIFPTQYGNQKSIETGLKVGDKLFSKKP